MELIRGIWTNEDYEEFRRYLYSVADEEYRDFHSRLVPGMSESIIGIRIPVIRKIAKEIAKGNSDSFLRCIRGDTSEERIIEGLVLASKKCGYEELLDDLNRFADRINSWAVNDTVKFNGIKKYRREMTGDIGVFLNSKDPWHVRFGLKILMDFYLDGEYIDLALELAAAVNSDNYYVCMMQGWLFATAAVKYSDKVFDLLESGRINDEVIVITAGKMRDSYRISNTDKERVRGIKARIRDERKRGRKNAEKQ